MKKLSDEKMWRAVRDNDCAYDGVFYYGVRTTGIFCRPSCKSRIPNRENVVYFEDAYAACRAGFRPCKRCRPDLLEPQVKPAEEACARTAEILRREYDNPDILDELPGRIRVSPYHLQRLYKKHTGFTPRSYLQRIRIDRARVLLSENGMNNTEICYAVGFQSLSRFYEAFRRIMGVSPRKYRLDCLKKRLEGEANENCI